MATIYRFIVEQKVAKGGDGRKVTDATSKSAAKKGRSVTLLQSAFGGGKGGVEHNRKMRALNPLVNRITGGVHEKAMRLGRAGLGLLKFDATTGAFAGLSATAIAIIVSFAIQMSMKELERQQKLAAHQNEQNFKQLENGMGAVRGQYKVATNILTGRHTYNQNK